MVATLLALAACEEDPILARARADAAAKAEGVAPSGPPGEATAPAPADAGSPPPGGAGVAGDPPKGDPTQPPPGGAPVPGVAGEPAKGDPSQPSPTGRGVPDEPSPAPPGAPGGGKPGIPGDPGARPGGVARVEGPAVAVAGTVAYAGWRAGQVRIDAFDGDHTRHGTQPGVVASARLDRPGPFSIDVPQGAGKLYFEAVIDEDGDGKPGPQDPMGTADRYPVTVGTTPITGLTITLKRREPPPGGKKQGDY